MLPSQPLKSSRSWVIALALAMVVNTSLGGLIYGLTLGKQKAAERPTVSINFRQFTDSSVTEKQLDPELALSAEVSPELTALPRPRPVLTVTPELVMPSAINLPAVAPPKLEVNPAAIVSFDLPVEVAETQAGEAQFAGIDGISAAPEIGIARMVRNVTPQYPYKAKRRRIEGYVLLHILIDDEGRAQEIKVVEEKPRGYFAKAARQAARRSLFQPAATGSSEWKRKRYEFKFE